MAFKDRPFFRRVLEVHELLRRGRPLDCTRLAQRFGTSKKTVQRLVEQMRADFGAPIAFDRKKESYVYTEKGWRPPFLPVDAADLFAIGLASKVLRLYEGTPAYRDLEAAYARIAKVLPDEIRVSPSSLVERLWIHPEPTREIRAEVWDAVTEALRDRTVLAVSYRKPGGIPEEREIEPYTLLVSGHDWFLAARDPESDSVKTFYLSRIVSATGSARRYAIPRTFDAARHFGDSIGIFVGRPAFRFRVLLSKKVAPWALEVRWHPKQKVTPRPDGSAEIELPAGNLLEARWFVLSFGREARALSPDELVADLAAEAKEMAASYA